MKLPYGIGDFSSLIKDQYYYVDKTQYIQTLENLNSKFVFFLRPRRFGKSLWISTLQAYYGLEYAADFPELFGPLYIGSHKTHLANSYYVLRFDFSGIDTSNLENTERAFDKAVENHLLAFENTYGLLGTGGLTELKNSKTAAQKLSTFLAYLKASLKINKLFVLIDEYDHFANELLATSLSDFSSAVTQSGFVRKFYEVLKIGTSMGQIDRIFVTGVSPITLDSLTSGFNIASHISLSSNLQTMLGFTQAEVDTLANKAAQSLGKPLDAQILPLLKNWYNGYGFSERGICESVYNSDMVLYFFDYYLKESGQIPSKLIDQNIASDYGKLRRLFTLQNANQNRQILNEIIQNKGYSSVLTEQFSFERPFGKGDFVSLLYYLGFLTIKSKDAARYQFVVPNEVILKLYFENFVYYFLNFYLKELTADNLDEAFEKLRVTNLPQLLLSYVEKTLKTLSNRDFPEFSEKHIKSILVAFLTLNEVYQVKSDSEINQKYPDILMLRRPGMNTPYQFLFELKYLHKKDAKKLPQVYQEGFKQVQGYLSLPEVARIADLKSWLLIFVGNKLARLECIDQQSKLKMTSKASSAKPLLRKLSKGKK